MARGKLRIGRTIRVGRGYRTPKLPGYTTVAVVSWNRTWKVLSPYNLKDEKGRLMENVWQFAKLYKKVRKTTQRKSQWDKKIIWKVEKPEIHLDDDDKITPEYWAWRKRGMEAKDPIRYPVGYKYRHECLFAIAEGDEKHERLDYIQARKKIYVPEYARLVKQHVMFKGLKKRLEKGENILIIDVDGPHQESVPYYQEKYNVDANFVENDSVECTEENMRILLNDPKHPYGHGYVCATALLGKDIEWNV
jgi:hypothetical protein